MRGLSSSSHVRLTFTPDATEMSPPPAERMTMRSLLARMRRNRLQSSLILAGFAFALVAAMVVATEATSRPAFCATCHEMTPYYDAWGEGPHASVDCVACHVDPGIAAEISHKAVALQEVYVHYTGDPKFPGSAEVPDSRCVSCHEGTIDPGIPDFDHETHRAGRPCVSCHAGIGHTVSSSALAEAGILDPEAYAQAEVAEVAAVGEGAANLEDHAALVVPRSRRHRLRLVPQAACTARGHRHADMPHLPCDRRGLGLLPPRNNCVHGLSHAARRTLW